MDIILADVVLLSWVVSTVWFYVSLLLVIQRTLKRPYNCVLSRIKGELQPFYLPCLTVLTVFLAVQTDMSWWDYLNTLTSYACYWIFKNIGDDNDRWKKRLNEAKEKVSVFGGRLVVTPA